MIENTIGTILIATLVAITVYLYFVISLLYYLKNNHRETWLHLGSPSILNNTIFNNFRLFTFVYSEQYRDLNDRIVVRRIRIIVIIFFCVLGTYCSWHRARDSGSLIATRKLRWQLVIAHVQGPHLYPSRRDVTTSSGHGGVPGTIWQNTGRQAMRSTHTIPMVSPGWSLTHCAATESPLNEVQNYNRFLRAARAWHGTRNYGDSSALHDRGAVRLRAPSFIRREPLRLE